jgi:hypothetical protein
VWVIDCVKLELYTIGFESAKLKRNYICGTGTRWLNIPLVYTKHILELNR